MPRRTKNLEQRPRARAGHRPGCDRESCPGCAPFKRSGLHRLSCPSCPTYAYLTVATLEDAGMPRCWREGCGDTLEPERLELAILLKLEDHPLVQAWKDDTRN